MDELELAPREASLAPDPRRGAMTTRGTHPKQSANPDRRVVSSVVACSR